MNMQTAMLLTPYQQRVKEQKKKFIADFRKAKAVYERKGVNVTTEALCRLFSGKYQKSTDMLRRYLKEENVI